MNKSLIVIAALLLFSPIIAGKAQQNPPSTTQTIPFTIPSSSTQTIPSDVSFQLGRQSGKIDDMTGRLDNIERDVKDISHDLGRLNVYASIAGVILLAIVAPLLYKGVERWVFKQQSA